MLLGDRGTCVYCVNNFPRVALGSAASEVAFDISFRMVDPINLTGVWLNPDTATRFGINEC